MEECSENLEGRMETLEKGVQTLKETLREMRKMVEEVSVEVRKAKKICETEKNEQVKAGNASEDKRIDKKNRRRPILYLGWNRS